MKAGTPVVHFTLEVEMWNELNKVAEKHRRKLPNFMRCVVHELINGHFVIPETGYTMPERKPRKPVERVKTPKPVKEKKHQAVIVEQTREQIEFGKPEKRRSTPEYHIIEPESVNQDEEVKGDKDFTEVIHPAALRPNEKTKWMKYYTE